MGGFVRVRGDGRAKVPRPSYLMRPSAATSSSATIMVTPPPHNALRYLLSLALFSTTTDYAPRRGSRTTPKDDPVPALLLIRPLHLQVCVVGGKWVGTREQCQRINE